MKEPSSLQMVVFLGTLGWIGYAWDAYMTLSAYGSILAVFAGFSFVYLARESATDRSLPWLFGWDDEYGELLLRCPAYASIFVGPATKHVAQWVAPTVFEGPPRYILQLWSSRLL